MEGDLLAAGERTLRVPPKLMARRRAAGNGGMEAPRILKRRLSDVFYRALHADTTNTAA